MVDFCAILELQAVCQTAMKANSGSGDTALHKACRNGRSVCSFRMAVKVMFLLYIAGYGRVFHFRRVNRREHSGLCRMDRIA